MKEVDLKQPSRSKDLKTRSENVGSFGVMKPAKCRWAYPGEPCRLPEETDLHHPVLLIWSLWVVLQEGMTLNGLCFVAQWGVPEGGRRHISMLTGPPRPRFRLTKTNQNSGHPWNLQDSKDGKGA